MWGFPVKSPFWRTIDRAGLQGACRPVVQPMRHKGNCQLRPIGQHFFACWFWRELIRIQPEINHIKYRIIKCGATHHEEVYEIVGDGHAERKTTQKSGRKIGNA